MTPKQAKKEGPSKSPRLRFLRISRNLRGVSRRREQPAEASVVNAAHLLRDASGIGTVGRGTLTLRKSTSSNDS